MSDIASLKIIKCTNQESVLLGYPMTNLHEFKQFIDKIWLRFSTRLPDLASQKMEETTKYNGFILLDYDRYKNMYLCIIVFLFNGHHEDFNNEATWMRYGILLRHLASLEKEIFVHTGETLLNISDGHLVLDAVLIGSRTKDV